MSTHNFKISLFRIHEEHLSYLEKISKETFYESFSPHNSEDNIQYYLNHNLSSLQLLTEIKNPMSQFYMATVDDENIGYLKINFLTAQTELKDQNCLEIERIYVSKKYHGLGIGQILMEKALNIAGGLKVDFIWLGVWERNERAIAFYKKYGFEIFSSHTFLLGNDLQTDLMMRLNL